MIKNGRFFHLSKSSPQNLHPTLPKFCQNHNEIKIFSPLLFENFPYFTLVLPLFHQSFTLMICPLHPQFSPNYQIGVQIIPKSFFYPYFSHLRQKFVWYKPSKSNTILVIIVLTFDPWPIIKITYHIPRLGPFCHFPIKIPKLKNLKMKNFVIFVRNFVVRKCFFSKFFAAIFFISLLYVSLSSWKRDKGGDIWRNKIIITTQIQSKMNNSSLISKLGLIGAGL